MSWVDCAARRVPQPYDTVLIVSGVFQAPATVPRGACARGAYDQTPYWYWKANGGSTLICTTHPAR
jgi:hypothetical protein